MYSLIFAIAKNGVVGDTKSKYGMPWHYPEDLKFYKKMTTGQNCIMGRKTYDAIGSALPNRNTFVLTRDLELELSDAKVVNDINNFDSSIDYFICGGVNIFKQYWNLADKIYITRIDEEHNGDVTFTDFDLSNFELIESVKGDNPKLTFETWLRK